MSGYKITILILSILIGGAAVMPIYIWTSMFVDVPDHITPSIAKSPVPSPNVLPNATHTLAFDSIDLIVHKRHKTDMINALSMDISNHGGYVKEYSAANGWRNINAVVPASYIDRLKPLDDNHFRRIHPTYVDWIELTRQIPDPVVTEGPLTSVSIELGFARIDAGWKVNALIASIFAMCVFGSTLVVVVNAYGST